MNCYRILNRRGLSFLVSIFLYNSVSFGIEPFVKTKLISDHTMVTANDSIRIGILFTIPKGYHIYWQNPGDAGLQPTVDINYPEEFKTGPLQWPLPDQLEEAGGLKVNVYRGEVLLYTKVLTPVKFQEASVSLRANLEWMVCKETCVLEKSSLDLTIPFSKKSEYNETAKMIFNWYEKLVPRSIQEYPYLSISSDIIKPENKKNNTVIREIHIKSLDLNNTFMLTGDTIQWFNGTVDNAMVETVSFDQRKSNAQLLIFRLETKKIGKQGDIKSNSWGVVKFRMKMDNDTVLQHGLILSGLN